MDEVASKAIRDLRIDDLSLGSDATITEPESRPSKAAVTGDQTKIIWQKCVGLGFSTLCT